MGKRKFALTVITLLISAVLWIFAGCSGSENPVSLVDFPETLTEEVILGDFYKVKNVVKDEEGNEHLLTSKVEDSTGNDVKVVLFEFQISDLNGYKITYTATVQGKSHKMTVNVKVKDDVKPDVRFYGGATGLNTVVGAKFTLPTIVFNDLGGLSEKSVKLFRLNGEETEITLTEESGKLSFVPNHSGIYEIRATAKDVSGNVTEKSYKFFVYENTEIYNPAIDALNGVRVENANGAKGYPTYFGMDETREGYQGGYISVKSDSDQGVTTVRILKNEDTTAKLNAFLSENKTTVKVWVKVSASAGVNQLTMMWNAGVSPITYVNVETNEWVQIELDINSFKTTYDKEVWITNVNLNQGGITEFCLGAVSIGEEIGVELGENEIYNPGVSKAVGVKVENANGGKGYATYYEEDETREDYKGSYISMKSDSDQGLTTLRILKNDETTAQINALKAKGAKTVKVWVKAVSTNATLENMMWNAGVSPITYVTMETNKWVQIELDIDNFKTTYDKEVWLFALSLNANGLTEFCIGSIEGDVKVVPSTEQKDNLGQDKNLTDI